MCEHKWHVCNSEHCIPCSSGLDYCEVCHGAEGSLTTECCGRPLTKEEERRIFMFENLDFRNGQWQNGPTLEQERYQHAKS